MAVDACFDPHHRVIKVAREFVDQVSFAVSDKSEFAHEKEQLGLSDVEEVVAGMYDSEGHKYAMTEKFR